MFAYLKAKLFGGIESKVPGFIGECYPTWVNRNQVMNRFDGGVTGFFKLVKGSKEFHGIVGNDGCVYSTERVYGRFTTPRPVPVLGAYEA